MGGRVRVVGIPGGTPKIEEKTWISSGVTVNLTGYPGGKLQKNRYPHLNKGVQIFLEKPK